MNRIRSNGVWPPGKAQCSCKGKRTNNIESYPTNMCMCKKQAHLLRRLKDSHSSEAKLEGLEKRSNRTKFCNPECSSPNKVFGSSRSISLKNILSEDCSIYSGSQGLSAAYAQTYRRAEQKLREYKEEDLKDQSKVDACRNGTSTLVPNFNDQIHSAECQFVETKVTRTSTSASSHLSSASAIDLVRRGSQDTVGISPFLNHITIRPKISSAEPGAATPIDEIITGRAKSLCGSFNLAGDTMEGIIQCLVFLKAFSVCASTILKHPVKVGGQGKTVEVYETVYSKRKYYRGRYLPDADTPEVTISLKY